MNIAFDISIVISSFNTENKIVKTVRSIFECNLTEFRAVELIIIDDGSPKPIEMLVKYFGDIPSIVRMRIISQPNKGIGETRNRGFKESQSSHIIFLDDDIIVYKDTIKELFASHREIDAALVFGNYPFISYSSNAMEFFAYQLYSYSKMTTARSFEKVNALTSGLLSVNKLKLGMTTLYKDNLITPAAEECEVVQRFNVMGIGIFYARHICAIHNHHFHLRWLVSQQYKYGLGIAEVFLKYPQICDLEPNTVLKETMNASSLFKSMAASKAGRKVLSICALTIERLSPNRNHNYFFGILAAAYFRAGYKAGMKKFVNS